MLTLEYRKRLSEPVMVICNGLDIVQQKFNLSEEDLPRILGILAGMMREGPQRELFEATLAEVRKVAADENIAERADMELAIEDSAAVGRKQ